MADNYLENKMDALNKGKIVVRRNSPSLDTLIRRLSGETLVASGKEPVKKAQMEAAVRSALLLGEDFEYDLSEEAQCVRIRMSGPYPDNSMHLGQAMLAIRLKAAELGICTAYTPLEESTASVTVKFFKQ